MALPKDIAAYHKALTPNDRKICALLAREIDDVLKNAEKKIWHRHPVWFLDGNRTPYLRESSRSRSR